MSELQIGLLVIGFAVVLLVYGYGAWQQYLYRRKYGAAFRTQQGDALYQQAGAGGGASGADPLLAADETMPLLEDEEVCVSLDAACDYIAEFAFDIPVRANALALLWDRRFDFDKNVNVCGLTAEEGEWVKVIADSKPLFVSFRLALQLVDRNGAIGEAHLREFHDLVHEISGSINAQAEIPDVNEAAGKAARLDEFCAEVDHMIGLNIMPEGHQLLRAGDVARIAGQFQMELYADGAFHLLDVITGHTLFSLVNLDNIPFQHHTLDQMDVFGLSLQLDVPRVANPAQRFDAMADLARELAAAMEAGVVDDYRAPLTEAGINAIRTQVMAIERKMQSRSIVPGSPLARRLFS